MFFINYVFVSQPEVAGAAFISLSALRRYVRKKPHNTAEYRI